MSSVVWNLCRLCLKESDFKFSLFTGNILDKIEALTSIKIEEDVKLPNTCCESCLTNVYTSYKFQQCIIESDRILREKLGQNESQIIEQAKQAPDLFEVLQLEGVSGNSTSMTEPFEPKLEHSETSEGYDYMEYNYKVEPIELSSEQSNVPNSMINDQILNSFLENRNSNIEDVGSSSDDLPEGSTMEYVYVDNLLDTPSAMEANIYHEMDIKGKKTLVVFKVDATNSEESENINNLNKSEDKLNIKSVFREKINTYNEKQETETEDDSNTGDANDVLRLGIQAKFCEKFAVYREKLTVNQTELECVDCEIKFDSKGMLRKHMMKHKIDKCPFCSITMRSDNLKRHMQIHTDAPEVCDICGKIAKNKESLRGHINYQHKNSRMFKCEPCNREFKSNHHYKTHLKKIHLGIRNHQCHICGKKFFANHDLNKHINMTHRGARPYVCQFCKKAFSSLYARKTHIRQHTLETPYRCEICAAGFRQKVSLVTHLKSKHSITHKIEENS